ncbi:hypothetical protein OHB01_09120 [Microbispora hainanensis]|jgi:hypothetical protein|uniref:DUF320 domain-containing protein n=1 Tax=Microbispora hainanensis TaxID=568844 RepID=A0ABZ1SM12_9ACTN|nr:MULTISPECIES: hypothetical protein [Microbispora]NJP28479.1 hypothetical protein [Microbispora sp. CL1-1]TQS08335.1 hypothetical protein FLW53_30645 [Microbispora sp. SCL1-1]
MRGGLALVAATVMTAALAAHATVAHAATQTAGSGDRNGNTAGVRVGNGIRNVSQLTVGSARNGSGIQHRTIGVGGVANGQSIICRRGARLCKLTQRLRGSLQES